MYEVLSNLRVVEAASFIAAPSCCLHLLQLGAEVIRIDPIGGGPDFGRWPRAADGASLYWEGLNKGKKSIAIDLSSPEGRELAVAVATAPGDGAGLFVTNFPVGGFLAHERLAAKRLDMITLRVMGWPDGRNAIDYTINALTGYPLMTGPEHPAEAPVNHVLPAWDLITGSYAAFALLAKERERRASGSGGEIRLALGDVAAACLGHLGQIAEVEVTGKARPKTGNSLFGAFGRDFVTRDGQRVMITAITRRQWRGLLATLGLEAAIAALEATLGISFATDEGERFRHRGRVEPLVAEAVASRDAAELLAAFETAGVCAAPYRTTLEAVRDEPAFVRGNPVFEEVRHPSGRSYPTPGAAARFVGSQPQPIRPAPRLGQHTEQVLAEVLGLASGEIAWLHDRGIVAGAGAEPPAGAPPRTP